MEEIIKELESLNINQTAIEFEESDDITDEIYEKYFKNEVASGLNIVRHRWYETSVRVFELPQGFLGVESVTDLYSEQMGISDCDEELTFVEMEPVTTITYKVKK